MSFRKQHPQLRALCFSTTTTMPNPPTAPVSPPSPRILPDRLANLIIASKSIVAAVDLLPFPYLKGALGPVIPILEAVQHEDLLLSLHLLAHRRFVLHPQGSSVEEETSWIKCITTLPKILETDMFIDVFFIDASTGDTIQAGLKNIALTRFLGNDHEDALLWLTSSTAEWLLIFDNADDPKLNLFNFFPQSNRGNILITSRNPQLCLHAPDAHHRISDLEQETAVQLLLVSAAQPATSETEKLATKIVKVLHCFPLAVVQAGAYILKTQSLRRYLALYKQNQARLLSEVSVQSHDKYTWSVYTTWDISFRCLSKQAAQFMQLCSFLHHEGISEGIFSNAALYIPQLLKPTEEQVKEPRAFLGHFLTATGAWSSLHFADMAAEIQEYSLINQDPTTGLFSIHPLVHSWCRNIVLDVEATRECTGALLAMAVSWKDKLVTMRLLPHITTVIQAESKLATEFVYPYQRVYYDAGNFQRAMELCEDLLEKVKVTLGAEHPKTLTVMASLAHTRVALGKLPDAAELEEAILEARRQTLGPEHPDTLTAMAHLADTYWVLGKWTYAEGLQVVVLEKSRQTLGPDHPHTVAAMEYLANTYRSLGKLTDAEALGLVVLEMRRQTLGSEHPDTLTSMANLAHIYYEKGKLTDAVELEVVVLEKKRQTLGPEHPDTVTAMANLANTYSEQGNLTNAEELEVVVLEKRRQTLGPEHPHTLTAMGNLASTYQELGKFTDAVELEVVVLAKIMKTLGPEHPDTLQAMGHLATTYRKQGKWTDTEELQTVVLEKSKQTLGFEHPDTLIAMANLATTYRALGKLTESKELGTVVLEQTRQTLGPEHPDTLNDTRNLAATYRDLGKVAEAKQLFAVVVEVRTRLLGPMHPDTISAQRDLDNSNKKRRITQHK
ncbi:hypothetical protein C8J57DRAFT_1720189 [Mycena rebaudengoi]|nr:hypothetical protein C8J57DRAFT_1720189 [Mycena rebaudengoi]